MRVYVPLLLTDLAGLRADATLPRRPAFGVTGPLRAGDPGADEEELEFEAMCGALDAARDLGAGRRAVAAADVTVSPTGDVRGMLVDPLEVPVGDVVSFHVEEGQGPAGTGYDDLLWYDVTELGLLGS
ncbi:DUF6912 family protein [Janibacter corallicola]|uniref:DUF6912 family protein n=1 Tax=Janibacter corallicola TaxID=415212 RepID=UPI00082B0B5F|nr:hypothetical protein [Janibacter corallicola]